MATTAAERVVDFSRLAIAKYQHLRQPEDDASAVPLYWCEGLGRPLASSLTLRLRGRSIFAPNFGDCLSPLVVSLVSGRRVRYSVRPGKLLALGSIFFALKNGDTVWGSGLGRREHADYAKRARNVTWAAIRGPRTRKALGQHGVDCPEVYGDPAILLPLYVSNDVPVDVELGIVPHWTHYRALAHELVDPEIRVIDVCAPWDTVARSILSCRAILSTSLHGVIFAESYGIPAILLSVGNLAPLDLTKFADYFESTNRDLCVRPVNSVSSVLRTARGIGGVPAPRFDRQALLMSFPSIRPAVPETPAARWSRATQAWLSDNAAFGGA